MTRGITSTMLAMELRVQNNKSRVVSVVSVIVVGSDISCLRNLSAVLLLSWLNRAGFVTEPLVLPSVNLIYAMPKYPVSQM